MTTEAEALASILAWSTDSPSWQRDALRRLATQAALEPAEIDELASICKGDNPAMPLEAGHLRDPNRDQGEVCLRQMHGVRHVNALAPDQRLTLRNVSMPASCDKSRALETRPWRSWLESASSRRANKDETECFNN